MLTTESQWHSVTLSNNDWDNCWTLKVGGSWVKAFSDYRQKTETASISGPMRQVSYKDTSIISCVDALIFQLHGKVTYLTPSSRNIFLSRWISWRYFVKEDVWPENQKLAAQKGRHHWWHDVASVLLTPWNETTASNSNTTKAGSARNVRSHISSYFFDFSTRVRDWYTWEKLH